MCPLLVVPLLIGVDKNNTPSHLSLMSVGCAGKRTIPRCRSHPLNFEKLHLSTGAAAEALHRFCVSTHEATRAQHRARYLDLLPLDQECPWSLPVRQAALQSMQ